MTKLSKEEVFSEFNINTNMSVDELDAWLDNPKSQEAGTGVGIESGHKIVEILEKNPTKDPEKYDDEDIEHMQKVVNYNKRHLAQEDKLKETKTREELEDTNSTKSLRNWGHDPVKTLDEESKAAGSNDASQSQKNDGVSAANPDVIDTGGTKRKHAESDEEDAEGESEDGIEDEEDPEDKSRARKKSKTDGQEEMEEDDDGN